MPPPKRLPRLLLAIAVLATAGLGADALARDSASRLPDVVRRAERDGQMVLKAEDMRRGDQAVPRVKVLTPDGRVRVLRDPPAAPPASSPAASLRPPPRTGERALPVRNAARKELPVRDDGYGRED